MQNNKYLLVQVALYSNKKGDLDSNCKSLAGSLFYTLKLLL